MAASATRVRIALIGLGPEYTRAPAEFRPILAKRLQAAEEQLIDAGYDYKLHTASPDEGMAALELKLQSECPDAVVIGNGVRSRMELTHFMEQIIDTVRTSAPQAKLLFNTSPESTLEAVKRWFPIATKSA